MSLNANTTPWFSPDLNLEWHSAAFDEVVCVTDLALRGRDILVHYKWMDLTPPAMERRHCVKLLYRTGPWYDFAYWVKYVLTQVPSSRSLSSTIRMLKTCKDIMVTLDDCVLHRDPLPKPERPMPDTILSKCGRTYSTVAFLPYKFMLPLPEDELSS